MTAFVDQNKCTGCGLCPDICPQVFELSDDTATVITSIVPEEAEGACREAAEKCPVEAISLKE